MIRDQVKKSSDVPLNAQDLPADRMIPVLLDYHTEGKRRRLFSLRHSMVC